MLTTSRYLNGGSPIHCRSCNQPFQFTGTHFSAWHGADGQYYCSSDCERDTLEAKARRVLS